MAYSKKVSTLTFYNGRHYLPDETITFLAADEQIAATFYGDKLPEKAPVKPAPAKAD